MRYQRDVSAAILLCLILSLPATADQPPRPLKSFDSAKRVAREAIYAGHETTLYCGCSYIPGNPRGSGGKIDPTDCGYEPRKNAKRGEQLEWEHIVPAAFFGKSRACWKQGHERCVNSKGKAYKGRSCCTKVDRNFRQMEADLHNLAPAVGELNGDRSNLPYGIVPDEVREYGRCDFEIGNAPKRAEPRPVVRGDVARVWFYMSDTYGVKISPSERGIFEEWSVEDRPDRWEKLRDKRIEAAQGNRNPYVRDVP